MSIIYKCESCLADNIQFEDLVEDPYMELLSFSRRCPKCGTCIQLYGYTVDNNTTEEEYDEFEKKIENLDSNQVDRNDLFHPGLNENE